MIESHVSFSRRSRHHARVQGEVEQIRKREQLKSLNKCVDARSRLDRNKGPELMRIDSVQEHSLFRQLLHLGNDSESACILRRVVT